MRLSDLGRSNLMISNLNRQQSALDKLSMEISSGKRILTVADNPSEYSTLLSYKDTESLTEGYIKNTQYAKSDLEIYDSQFSSSITAIRETKNLLIQASNSPGYTDTYTELKQKANSLLETLVNTSNSSVKGEYMFSGSKTTTKPFEVTRDESGLINSVTYSGDSQAKTYSFYTSERISINLSGEEVFEGPAGMEENIFTELINICNDLQAAEFKNSDLHLQKVDKIFDRFVNKQGELGSTIQHFERLENFMTNYNYSLQEKSSKIEYIDMAESITNLLAQENNYSASLEVAARMNNLSLLDYIR